MNDDYKKKCHDCDHLTTDCKKKSVEYTALNEKLNFVNKEKDVIEAENETLKNEKKVKT